MYRGKAKIACCFPLAPATEVDWSAVPYRPAVTAVPVPVPDCFLTRPPAVPYRADCVLAWPAASLQLFLTKRTV